VQAKQLVQIAEEQNKTLMVGHVFRYNSAVRKIKELLNEGKLGQVYYMFGHFMGLKDPRLDVGAVFNFTVHHIDIYNYLLDKLPEEVTCCVGFFLQRKDFEDVAFLALKYPGNILGIVEGSWLPPGKYRDLTVVGSRKSVTSDLLKQTLELHNIYIEAQHGQLKAVDKGSTKIDIRFEEPLKLELLDFIKCIKTGQTPLADGRSALSVVKTAEKAIESAKLGRSVRIVENE
jgi:UDP-N-acetylglucosamine 3-dehydrogenase